MKKSIFCILFLILIYGVSAATLYGSIYSVNLEKVEDAIVAISTEPRQTYVAKNGTYMFKVSPGQYTIAAFKSNGENLELIQNIIIKEEGEYILDLILFPSIKEEEELLNITQYDFGEEYFEEKDYTLYWIIAIIGIVSFLIIAYFILRPKPKVKKEEIKPKLEEEDDVKKIINFIKQQGGRITQKDIRKQFPSSEAKISLIITELEKKGVIEKIKKGRGNIIKLKQ